MELTLNKNFATDKKQTVNKTKALNITLLVILTVLTCGFAYAGSDDGALGEIWSYLSEGLTGAPGKILAACMLFSVGYFSVLKPNPGLAAVSFLIMLIIANGEKIIGGFMDAGVPL